jgi:hypothetical protein
MNPTDAAALADELRNHLMSIARLDAHPTTNAAAIEWHRQEAKECTDALGAFLVMSDTFGGL